VGGPVLCGTASAGAVTPRLTETAPGARRLGRLHR